MNAVTGNSEDINNISIQPPNLTMENNAMPHIGLTGLIFMAGIPVLLVLFGLIK